MKDVADKKVVEEGFQSENIVAQMVEVLTNILQPTDKDNEDTIIQMENSTIHHTKMLPQLLEQMRQMQTLMVQMNTQLNNTNKNCTNDNRTSVGYKSNKVPSLIQF